MSNIHSSLQVSTNIRLILLWGIIAGVLFSITTPHSWLILIIAAILGMFGGVMQWMGFHEAKASFLEAHSLLDVRAKLKATRWGKRYIYFLWSSGVLLGLIAILWGNNPIIDFPMGYFNISRSIWFRY